MPGFAIKLTGAWNEARRRLENGPKEVKRRQVLAIRRAALILEGALKQGMRDGAPGGDRFKPLALTTVLLRRKHSDKPLLDTGALLGSISTVIDDSKPLVEAFVGVKRGAKGAGGIDLQNLAVIHEYGTAPFTIFVTDGIRRLFIHLSIISNGAIKPLKKETTYIRHPGVPARPFFGPTLRAIRPRLEQEIKATLEKDGGPI